MIDPRTENRVWLIITSRADGGSDLTISRMDPSPSSTAVAMLRARGKAAADQQVVRIPPLPAPTPPVLSKVEFSIVLPDAYVVGLAAGADNKRISCAGLKTTDSLIIQPTGVLPAGYGGLTIGCTENGWARVGFVRPLLAVGANNSLALKITAFR